MSIQFEVVNREEIEQLTGSDEPVTIRSRLLEDTGRKVENPNTYFSFWISGKQFTAPTDVILRLRRVSIDKSDDGLAVSSGGVLTRDEWPLLDTPVAVMDEVFGWTHQVYMAILNDERYPNMNVVLHTNEYGDGGWQRVDYLAAINMPSDIKVRYLTRLES